MVSVNPDELFDVHVQFTVSCQNRMLTIQTEETRNRSN